MMISFRTIFVLAATGAVGIFATDVSEAGSVTLLSTEVPPTLQSYSIENGNLLGEQFTLGQSATISEVDMQLASGGLNIPAADLAVQIYKTLSNGNVDLTHGFDGTIAVAPANLDTSSFESVAFKNTNGLTLGAGTYYLMLYNTSTTAPVYWQEYTSAAASSYGSVSGKIFQGPSSYVDDTYLGFVMSGTAVPEPSSIVLSGLGLAIAGGVAALRRRRSLSMVINV